MDWTDDDVEQAEKARRAVSPVGGTVSWADQMRAIMTRAVELVRALGGTMTAGEIDEAFREFAGYGNVAADWMDRHDRRLHEHICTQGATVATLQGELQLCKMEREAAEGRAVDAEADRATLQEKVEELEAVVAERQHSLEQMHDSAETEISELRAEVGRLTSRITSDAARYAKEREHASGLAMRLRAAESRLSAVDARAVEFCALSARDRVERLGALGASGLARWVLEGDAATPGHPERVKDRSERLNEALFRADDDTSASESDAYNRGAEAMREACLKAVQQCLQEHGYGGDLMKERLKAAIEEAAP